MRAGDVTEIRTQILNSFERLNYMQTLRRASLKNNYFYQALIILVDIQARTYNFMIRRIPRGFKNFTRKNKRCYVSLPIPYIELSLSRGHQTVTIMNRKIHCF